MSDSLNALHRRAQMCGSVSRHQLPGVVLWVVFLGFLLGGCASRPSLTEEPKPLRPPSLLPESLAESPVPDGVWRGHRVSWCEEDKNVPPSVETLLGLCSEYFREGSGTDGMLELEFALEKEQRHPLLLLTLGQLYLIAGQGDPDLLPPEGPAADVGDWSRNRERLLSRCESLLREAARSRSSDAAIDYLLADVARSRRNRPAATHLMKNGSQKCTYGRGFAIMTLYQQLNRYPGRYLGGPGPDYPAAALKSRIVGDVVLDLLISPNGLVRQAVVVESPNFSLSRAAATSLKSGSWEAARIGKYPVWSWLRVSTSFTLDN